MSWGQQQQISLLLSFDAAAAAAAAAAAVVDLIQSSCGLHVSVGPTWRRKLFTNLASKQASKQGSKEASLRGGFQVRFSGTLKPAAGVAHFDAYSSAAGPKTS